MGRAQRTPKTSAKGVRISPRRRRTTEGSSNAAQIFSRRYLSEESLALDLAAEQQAELPEEVIAEPKAA